MNDSRRWIALYLLCMACVGTKSSDCATCDSSSPTAGDCTTLSLPECAARPDCTTINGRPLLWPDTAATCYTAGELEPLGCHSIGEDCTADIKLMQAPFRDCYEFGGCVPEGYTPCDVGTGVTECP